MRLLASWEVKEMSTHICNFQSTGKDFCERHCNYFNFEETLILKYIVRMKHFMNKLLLNSDASRLYILHCTSYFDIVVGSEAPDYETSLSYF